MFNPKIQLLVLFQIFCCYNLLATTKRLDLAIEKYNVEIDELTKKFEKDKQDLKNKIITLFKSEIKYVTRKGDLESGNQLLEEQKLFQEGKDIRLAKEFSKDAKEESLGAKIRIKSLEKIEVVPLKVGQKRFTNNGQYKINKVNDPELSKYNFIMVPSKKSIKYAVKCDKEGLVYAFGISESENNLPKSQKWNKSNGTIDGAYIDFCYTTKVKKGDYFVVEGKEIHISAQHISLYK